MFSIVSTSFHAMPADDLAFSQIHKTASPGCRGSRLWRKSSWRFRTASGILTHTITFIHTIASFSDGSSGIRRFRVGSSHKRFKFQ